MPHTAKRYYTPSLDALRFFAFLLIYFHHFNWANIPYPTFVSVMWCGVEMFFLLSSFLLTTLLCEERKVTGRIDVKHFYLRRVLRIVPIYMVYLAAIFYFWHDSIMATQGQRMRFLSLLGFYDDFTTAKWDYSPIPYASHLWTLSFEMQFYLLMPWLYLWLAGMRMRWRVVTCGAIWAVTQAARYAVETYSVVYPPVWVVPFLRPESLLAGILLGFALHEQALSEKKMRLLMGLIGGGAVCMTIWMLYTGKFDRGHVYLLYPVIAALFSGVMYFSRYGFAARFLSWAPLRYLGKISYGLYVYHMYFAWDTYGLLAKAGLPMVWWLAFPGGLAVTTVIASISYYVLERPLLRLKERYEVVASRPA